MSLGDLLKKLRLIDAIIKSEEYFKNKYQIDIKDSRVSIIVFDPRLGRHIDELFGKNGLGLVREDLVPPEIEMVSPPAKHREMIRGLEPYLSNDDLHSLVTASAIVRLEDKGKSQKARDLLTKLTRRFGERGRRIYNMLRSNVFSDFIYPFLDHFKLRFKDAHKSMFIDFFEEIITYYPFGIWVDEDVLYQDIVRSLKERFYKLYIPMVEVYGRGQENISKIIEACKCLKKEDKEIKYKKKFYELRDRPACTVRVFHKKRMEELKKKFKLT